MNLFKLCSDYQPAGDQPAAIEALLKGLDEKKRYQTLLGVTGSGKTYTIAQVIARSQRPALIMAPNKTLAAQLYREMKDFFPHNAVEYFVSYYDYYQPEAYVPSRDLYIEKDAGINEQIEQMRLCATKALVERKDVIIVATVSAIYGLGDPASYMAMILPFQVGESVGFKKFINRLIALQYMRNDVVLKRGHFKVKGEIIEVTPSERDDRALRIVFDGDEIERIDWIDTLTGARLEKLQYATIYPENHYVTPYDRVLTAIDEIQKELQERLTFFRAQGQHLEAQRIEHRTLQDIEYLRETGHCQGIENYSFHLSGASWGATPMTLLNYLPPESLVILDESHMMVSQIGAMYHGDRSRKDNLVQYGFRLPSCKENRPLMFSEYEAISQQQIFVSATPGSFEIEHSSQIVEQIVRPTGLIDPSLEICPVESQVKDACDRILAAKKIDHRVLITTLTKKMAEDLSEYLPKFGITARYLHSDMDAQQRVEAILALRSGQIDVLIGINLLREGLDMPEVALVLIFDADKEGFLRSTRSLIQTIGRAARHEKGHVVFYADRITKAMREAIDETERRREKQIAHNLLHGITPRSVQKKQQSLIEGLVEKDKKQNHKKKSLGLSDVDNLLIDHGQADKIEILQDLDKKMREAALALEFEKAAYYRDLKEKYLKAP